MTMPTVNWNDIEWTTITEGLCRKVFTGEGATLAMHKLEPGLPPDPHSHPHEQIVYIVEGVLDFHLGEDVHRLTPGSLIVVPPDVEHWVEIVGEEPVINIDIFTPMREEYMT